MARSLDFRWCDRVNQQMGVTVDQAGQQGRVAQIDCLHACWRIRLHMGGRTNFLDLIVFNQHSCRREHVPSARVEQSAGFYQCCRSGRLGGELACNKYCDCEQKDSAYAHMFVSDEMHENHYCSRARENLSNVPVRYVAHFCVLAGTNARLRTPILG